MFITVNVIYLSVGSHYETLIKHQIIYDYHNNIIIIYLIIQICMTSDSFIKDIKYLYKF